MGRYLSIVHVSSPFKDVPGWMADKWSGREEFFDLAPAVDKDFDDYEYGRRPANFAAWRAALDDPNGPLSEHHAYEDRGNIALFHRMLDALEADPNLWMRLV